MRNAIKGGGGEDQEWGKNDKKRAANIYFIQTFH